MFDELEMKKDQVSNVCKTSLYGKTYDFIFHNLDKDFILSSDFRTVGRIVDSIAKILDMNTSYTEKRIINEKVVFDKNGECYELQRI